MSNSMFDIDFQGIEAIYLEKKEVYIKGVENLMKGYSEGSVYYNYLSYLLSKLNISNVVENILTCKMDVLKRYKDEFDNKLQFDRKECLSKDNCSKTKQCDNCEENDELKKLQGDLKSLLKYENKKLKNYFINCNIKTCYVCNSQYAIVASKEVRVVKEKENKLKIKEEIGEEEKSGRIEQQRTMTKFQLDHYFPQSKYPIFAVSLHNLYPICGSCNQIKLDNIYDIEEIYSKISFRLKEDSIVEYYNRNGKVKLETIDNSTDSLGEKFDIDGIYQNHTDVIEELIERKIKYTDKYKEMLARSFPGIVGTEKNIDDRLIIGTYGKEEGFLKRPLSKFIHDINDQLDSFPGYYNKTK
ncbi:hypothetical protein [Myroides odoratimimus]|uniref:hypothetical protein n=1 Tax=Myroides odoratimimus TaxID=76832 RepID=UPI00091E9D4F|nr:hypothetical protein [Myroides odoratimimus]SHL88562.1 hypothetical protein SAMN05444275_107104 [Myroides odoratimimus subsp. xuanwuensis]